MGQDFDWTDDESIVLRDQPAIAVYVNPHGALVIRQERSWNEEEDTWIVIQRENVRLVALQMLAVLGMSADTLPPEQTDEPNSSGAARQKRYRERQTHHQSPPLVADGDTSVTPQSVTPITTDRNATVTRHAAGDGESVPLPLLRAVSRG